MDVRGGEKAVSSKLYEYIYTSRSDSISLLVFPQDRGAIKSRFDRYGAIPRAFLRKNEQELETQLQIAISNFDKPIIALEEFTDQISGPPTAIFMLTPSTEARDGYFWDFVSNRARDRFFDRIEQLQRENDFHLVRALSYPEARPLLGKMVERRIILHLQKGGQYKLSYRKMHRTEEHRILQDYPSTRAIARTDEFKGRSEPRSHWYTNCHRCGDPARWEALTRTKEEHTFSTLQVLSFSTNSDLNKHLRCIQQSRSSDISFLLLPKAQNFKGIDMLLVHERTIWWLQVTIAPTHSYTKPDVTVDGFEEVFIFVQIDEGNQFHVPQGPVDLTPSRGTFPEITSTLITIPGI